MICSVIESLEISLLSQAYSTSPISFHTNPPIGTEPNQFVDLYFIASNILRAPSAAKLNPALAGIIYHCCAVNLLQKTKSSGTRFYIRKRQKMKLWWSTVSINKEFSPPEGRQKKILNSSRAKSSISRIRISAKAFAMPANATSCGRLIYRKAKQPGWSTLPFLKRTSP